MRSALQVLAGVGRRLNRGAGRPALPGLWLVTDPIRTPDPLAAASRLPRGAGVIYRHFGARDRFETARALAALAQKRGLVLLIGADVPLARKVGAAGVHLPERLAWRAQAIKGRQPRWIVTAAAHKASAVTGAQHADAIFLAPVFPSRSPSASRPLGVLRAARLARPSRVPVIALGGVKARTAPQLLDHGFAGLAAIDGLEP